MSGRSGGKGGHPLIETARAEKLAAMRAHKMALSTHAFLRGSADLFYEVVDASKTKLPDAPSVWISGDCHAENIGAVADPSGEAIDGDGAHVAVLQLNDLDAAAITTPLYDLLRLSLSVTIAAQQAQRTGLEALSGGHAVVSGYLDALVGRSDGEVLPERLGKLLRHASREKRRDLLDHRAPMKHGKRCFIASERYWPLSDGQHADVSKLLADTDGIRALVGGKDDEPLEIVDVAFRVAGTGSLGCFRAAALVRVGGGNDDEALHLLDVKEAQPAPTPRAHGAHVKTPDDDGERVVAASRAIWGTDGQGRTSMVSAHLHGRSVVVRALRPQEDKLALEVVSAEELGPIARALGAIVGRAHAGQLAAKDRHTVAAAIGGDVASARKWLDPLLAELAAAHASAYTHHCAGCLDAARAKVPA